MVFMVVSSIKGNEALRTEGITLTLCLEWKDG
jgi:hypothetical protein